MKNTDERPLICKTSDLFSRDVVRHGTDGLDILSSHAFTVDERRLLFDDVQLVTRHVQRSALFLVLTALFGGSLVGLAIFVFALNSDMYALAIPLFVVGLPAILAFFIHLAVGREVITVNGRRSKLVLRFSGLRKQRARDVYGAICAAVRHGQSPEPPIVPESSAPPLPDSVLPPLP